MASSATDTRIMELQFENREFERNIAKSQKSIEDLKEAMDFEETSRGLNKFSDGLRGLEFRGLTDNIQKLTDKFTGLGNAGEYVLSRIRAGIEGTAAKIEQFVKGISLDQIPIGQGKYDALNKSVQTIIAGGKYSEEEAYSTMKRVMTYTSQTSHNFQTMVGQIASLQSIGMGLNEAELLIEGIGNASTKAGGGATEAANAMGVLSKAIGGNYLSYQQFLTLSQTARVVTDEWRQKLLEAGVAAGDLVKKNDKIFTNKKYGKQVEVTAKNLETTLSKKWASAETLKKMYSEYTFAPGAMLDKKGEMRDATYFLEHPDEAMDSLGKTAYLTGQRALTFADALNAVKESVSSGWMESFRHIFGDVTEAAEHFTNVCDRIVESLEKISEFRNDFLRSLAGPEGKGRTSIMQLLLGSYEEDAERDAYGLLDILDSAGKLIYDGFKNFMLIFAAGDEKQLMKEDPEYFVQWLGFKATKFIENVQNFLNGIRTFFNEPIEVNGSVTTRVQMIHEIVDGIVGALAIGYLIIKDLTGFFLTIVDQLQPSIDEITKLFSDLGISIYETAETENKAQKIKKFFDDLAVTITPVTTGINDVINSLTDFIRVLLGLDEASDGKGTETLSNFGNLLIGIFDAVSKVSGPILTFFSDFIKLLTALFQKGITRESLSEFGSGLGAAIKTMMKSFADNLPESLTFFGDWIRDLFGLWEEDGTEERNTFFTFLHKLFTEGFGSFNDFLGSLTSGMSLTTAIENGFGFNAAFNVLNTVAGWFKGTNLYAVIMAFLGVATVSSLFNLLHQAGKAVRTIGGFFDDVGGNLKSGILGEYEWFSERLLNFAKSIGILVACVVVLGSLNTGAVIQGVLALAAIVGIFIGLFLLINSYKGTLMQQTAAVAVIDGVAAAIAAVCISIGILSLAVIPLASDIGRTLSALLLVGGFLAIFGFFIKLMVDALDFSARVIGGGNQWAGIGKMAVMLLLVSGMMAVISATISALALAITPLAALGWGAMIRSILVVGAMLALFLSVFIVAIAGGKMIDVGSLGKMALMFIALSVGMALLAAAVAAIVVAVTPLALMSTTGFIQAIAGLGLIMLELAGFIKLMQILTVDNKTASVKIAGLAAFALSLGLLVLAVTPLGMMSISGSIQAVVGLGLILGELILFMKLLQGVTAGYKQATVQVFGLATFALSLGLLVLAITPLGLMSVSGSIQAVVGLGLILGELYGFMKLLQTAKLETTKLMGFVAFAFSMGLLVLAITPIAGMSLQGAAQAVVGLGLILAELFGFMKLLDSSKIYGKTLFGFAAFAASMGILIFSLKPLSEMSLPGAAQAVVGLGIILAEMVGFMKLLQVAKVDMGTMAGFIGFALSIAILMFALKPLSEMTPEGYLQALFGLGAVLLEIVAMMKILDELNISLKGSLTTFGLLLGLGVSMVLFGIAFNEIKDVPWQNIVAFAAGLSVLLLAVAGGAAIAEAISIKGVLLLAIGLAAVMGVIALLAPTLITSVSGGLRSASGDIAIMAKMLASFSTTMNGVDEGGFDKAERIFKKIPELIGLTAVMSLGSGATRVFMSMMSQLTLAIDEIASFDRKIGSISEDGGTAKAIGIIDKFKDLFENHLAGFEQYVTSSAYFYDALYLLGSGFDYFDSMTADIGDPADNKGLSLIKELAACAGDLDTIYKMNLDRFQTQLAGLGGALILYAQGAASVNSGEIDETTDVSGAITILNKITESLSQNGGFSIPDNMPAENELTDFGVQLAALAGALVAFESAGSGLGDGTKEAIKTLQFFSDLKSELEIHNNFGTDLGSAISSFKDENGDFIKKDELTTFGEDIAQLGSSMAHFAKSTQIVNEETGEVTPIDFSKATDALTAIASIQENLPSIGGVKDTIIGTKQDLGDLATELNLLGDALNSFHTNTTTFDEAQKAAVPMDFSNAQTFLESISDIQAKIADKVHIASFSLESLFVSPDMTLDVLGSQIAQLGGGLSTFSDLVLGKDENGEYKSDAFTIEHTQPVLDMISSMITFMQSIAIKLPKVGGLGNIVKTVFEGETASLKTVGDAIGEMGDGLSKFGDKIKGKFKSVDEVNNVLDLVDGFITILSKLVAVNADIGYTDFGDYAVGVYDFIGALSQQANTDFGEGTGSSVIDYMVQLASDINTGMAAIENLDTGNLDAFTTLTQALANLASINFATEDSNFVNVGMSIATGVSKGITDGTSIVTIAATDMAVAAYNAAMAALDANSPSKVFMNVGSYIGLGMALGIDGTSDNVVSSVNDMSDSAINTAGTVMATIGRIMAEETDANPTITPVLDLTNLNAGMDSFKRSLEGNRITIDADTSYRYAGSVGDSGKSDSSESIQNRISFDGIYERMNQMNQAINTLGTSIRSMKLVLDSGVVAGGVTDGVDQNIGRKAFYAARRN